MQDALLVHVVQPERHLNEPVQDARFWKQLLVRALDDLAQIPTVAVLESKGKGSEA